MRLPERAILILEGIHGLNDALTPLVERERKHKIYVSALTQLNLDDHNRIATTDNRLVRTHGAGQPVPRPFRAEDPLHVAVGAPRRGPEHFPVPEQRPIPRSIPPWTTSLPS